MSSLWKNKRVVAAGGAGLLGSYLVDRLSTLGWGKSSSRESLNSISQGWLRLNDCTTGAT